MKIVRISGNLWELTLFQEGYEQKEISSELFESLIKDKHTFCRGGVRTYEDYKVRSKAKVLIEVNEYCFREYNIYYGKGGFYILIKNKKHFLKDMELKKKERK